MPKRTPDSPPPPPTQEQPKSPERGVELSFIKQRVLDWVDKAVAEGNATPAKFSEYLYGYSGITNAASTRNFRLLSKEENEEVLKFKEELESKLGFKFLEAYNENPFGGFFGAFYYLDDLSDEEILNVGFEQNDLQFWRQLLLRPDVAARLHLGQKTNDELAELGHKIFNSIAISEYKRKVEGKDERTFEQWRDYRSGHYSGRIWEPILEHVKFSGLSQEELFQFGEKHACVFIWDKIFTTLGEEHFKNLSSTEKLDLKQRVLKAYPEFNDRLRQDHERLFRL